MPPIACRYQCFSAPLEEVTSSVRPPTNTHSHGEALGRLPDEDCMLIMVILHREELLFVAKDITLLSLASERLSGNSAALFDLLPGGSSEQPNVRSHHQEHTTPFCLRPHIAAYFWKHLPVYLLTAIAGGVSGAVPAYQRVNRKCSHV